MLVPGGDEAAAARAAEAVLRELEAGLAGYTFALGRSRVADDPAELPRAAGEALLAANVAEGDAERRVLAFEETGAYRLLLSAMSENPAELQRFYAETVEPLVAYDEQYETDLVRTLETFLEADGNVAGTAQRLFTHRHTIYYRLERVRELSRPRRRLERRAREAQPRPEGDARARHRLAGGPASEAGAAGGRVPRRRAGAPEGTATGRGERAPSTLADSEALVEWRTPNSIAYVAPRSTRRAARSAAAGVDRDAGVAVGGA